MKPAIIKLSQCHKGRLDAGYNLAFREHGKATETLKQYFNNDIANLRNLAIALPFNKEAQNLIAKGQGRNQSKQWVETLDIDDLALYVVIAHKSLDVQQVTQDLRVKASGIELAAQLVAGAINGRP